MATAVGRTARRLFFGALARSPAQWYCEFERKSRLAVLAYHAVAHPEQFERQMAYLCRYASPLDLDGLLSCLAGKAMWPHRPALITFDDGDRSVLEIAAPILHRLRIPAICFVVTGVLDGDTPHWWVEAERLFARGLRIEGMPTSDSTEAVRWLKLLPNEARVAAITKLRRHGAEQVVQPQLTSAELFRLEALGVAIGNHSHTHPCLPRCSTDKVCEEIQLAHQRLTQILGHPPRVFAFPDGGTDDRAFSVLSALGYEAAFAFDHRLSTLTPKSVFEISRLRVNDRLPLNEFGTILSGLHPMLHDARMRMRAAFETGQG